MVDAENPLFRVGTIGRSRRNGRKESTLLQAARHNLRELRSGPGAGSHIDPKRSRLNQVLAGPDSAKAIVAYSETLLKDAGENIETLRRDWCQAVELLFSLPRDTSLDTRAYFTQCLQWSRDKFGPSAILSAVVHYDEAAPHVHILVSPLSKGRACGSELVGRAALSGLRRSFYVLVARQFGLKPPQPRLRGTPRAKAAASVLWRLKGLTDGAVRSAVWPAIRAAIESDPRPFLECLGIGIDQIAPKRQRTSTQILTSRGRGRRIEG